MHQEPRVILDQVGFNLTINRLVFELVENHGDFANSAIIGIKPRGQFLAERLKQKLHELIGVQLPYYGNMDVTFYRDDFRRRDTPLKPETTEIDFIIENKNVILVDDVLFTGRTIRSAMDALLDFGRPRKVELLVLIDRRLNRHLPIEPNYTGKVIDSIQSERVIVEWTGREEKDQVLLLNTPYGKQ